LAGKVAVVTAAAGTGIGSAAARRLVLEGASVVISDAHERRLGEAAVELARLTETGTMAAEPVAEPPLAVPCDVTDEMQVQELFATAADRHGRIDDEWHRVVDVSLTGTFRCTRAALRILCAQGSGVIVNNASVLGWRAQAGQAHYAAAKAGVMALTRSAALEAAPFGVRVNAVAPSLAMHPFLAKVTSDELLDELAGREAFGRAAEPWEVATVIAFLASDYSTYMTGEVVSVSSQHP
jgi:3-oxoacyl-[acyl-carrier protein] reductase